MSKIKTKLVHNGFKIEFDKTISQPLRVAVLEVFNQYADRVVQHRVTSRWGHLTLDLGRSYRAIQKKGSSKWLILSHEKYNRVVDEKK